MTQVIPPTEGGDYVSDVRVDGGGGIVHGPMCRNGPSAGLEERASTGR